MSGMVGQPPSARSTTKGSGWAVLGLVLVCAATAIGLLLGSIALLYAGVTLVTGAPPHVQLSALRLFYIIALPVVAPLAGCGGVLSVVDVVRRRRAGVREHRAVGVIGVILAAVCLAGLGAGLPLLWVRECFDLYC